MKAINQLTNQEWFDETDFCFTVNYCTLSANYTLEHFRPIINVTYVNCRFENLTIESSNLNFYINCTFDHCKIFGLANTRLINCVSEETIIEGSITKSSEFINCTGFKFDKESIPIFEKSIQIINSECIKIIQDIYINTACEKNKKLRESITYGYKLINVPVIVKASFPCNARMVCNEDRTFRTDVAYVEAIEYLGGYNANSVVNLKFPDCCVYKVGQNVYPDTFDDDLAVVGGHGLHFFSNLEELNKVTAYSKSIEDKVNDLIKSNF